MKNEPSQSTVMLVDDKPANLNILQEILRDSGYRVVAFPQGTVALRAAAKKPPDIILLDILMPELNGYEVCQRLKADPVLKDIPVIFLSALSGNTDKIKAFKVGGVDYVTKPFFAAEVLARIKTHLNLRRLNLELDRMVEERTAQLLIANEALQEEIRIRLEAEDKIRESRARLQSVFDGISEPLFLLNAEMRVKLLNSSAATYCGFDTQALAKSDLEKNTAISESLASRDLTDAIAQWVAVVYERQGLLDPEKVERVYLYPVQENGIRTGDTIVRITDISEEIRLQHEMAQTDKLITLGTLVAGVAHEINNPNHVILLNCPILLDAWKSIKPILDDHYEAEGDFLLGTLPYSRLRSEIPDTISNIELSANRIKKIVSILKTYSAKSNQFEFSSVDLNAVVQNVILLLKYKIKEHTDHFHVSFDEAIPSVNGDKHKLEQAFINLISNALESLPDRNRGVAVTTQFDCEHQLVTVEVRDEGSGIPQDVLPYIMDPFYTTKSGQGGTGLGLAIVQQIIHAHQGAYLEAKSIEGSGTIFKVRFHLPPRSTMSPKPNNA